MLVVPFIVTEVCGLTVADTPYFYLPAVLASLACYPLVNGLAGRFGKWRVFAASLLASAVILPLLMLIGPWIPIPLMAQGMAWITLEAIAMSGVIMLPQAFAAEITDYDETVTVASSAKARIIRPGVSARPDGQRAGWSGSAPAAAPGPQPYGC